MTTRFVEWCLYVLSTALWGILVVAAAIAAVWIAERLCGLWKRSYRCCQIGNALMIGVAGSVVTAVVIGLLIGIFFMIGYAGLGVSHALGR